MADAWPRYHYTATLARTIDGDTVSVLADLGFSVRYQVTVRIAGMNAPEMHGATREAAIKARDRITELLAGRTLYIKTDKDSQSFARYVARVYLDPEGAMDVAAMLISEGLAVAYPSKV